LLVLPSAAAAAMGSAAKASPNQLTKACRKDSAEQAASTRLKVVACGGRQRSKPSGPRSRAQWRVAQRCRTASSVCRPRQPRKARARMPAQG